ncbi:hypothetical protein ACH4Y0_03120 [Streptomyces sp. NPDC020707]|uniref:hypothetical protein n=1 Tax=Streptomyces sp. NPDC020707 TaxID=3365084 RepID=UPI0037BA6618
MTVSTDGNNTELQRLSSLLNQLPELKNRQEAEKPFAVRRRASYEMRPVRTPSDRSAVVELVERRTRWLDDRGLASPYLGDPATAYRKSGTDAVALFEDGSPVGCLSLDRRPALSSWDGDRAEPSLLVSLAYTAPGHKTDMVGRLLTLWASDFAHRIGAEWARCEVPCEAPFRDGALPIRLLDHLTKTCGWHWLRTRRVTDKRPLALLQIPAQSRSFQSLIRCTVPVHPENPADHVPVPPVTARGTGTPESAHQAAHPTG